MPSLRTMAVFATAAAIGLSVAVAVTPAGAVTSVANPYTDPFYKPPANLAAVPNGTVLNSRQVTITTASGATVAVTAYQLEYRSEDANGNPVADVTTAILPPRRYLTPTPVLSFQVAEDSLGMQCAPSYTLQTGSTALSATEEMLILVAASQGWVVSVPDYEGAASAFGAGVQAGHAVLDGVRAVENFAATGTAHNSRVGLWGYSGGGQASAWAGELQGSYAPELNVAGVAEGGVPADVASIVQNMNGTAYAGLTFGVLTGLSRAYPSMSLGTLLNSAGTTLALQVGNLCAASLLNDLKYVSLSTITTVTSVLSLPSVSGVLAANGLGKHAPVAPVYDYHAVHDSFIPIGPDNTLQSWYCSQGVVDYHVQITYGDHVATESTGASGALNWLAARLAGKPAVSNCPV